jgi:hypothetical protein
VKFHTSKISLFLFTLLTACQGLSQEAFRSEIAQIPASQSTRRISGKLVHVLVALCDNQSQGIVPVPARIGNGDDPANNLYWGARFGVKTFFKRSVDWKLIEEARNPRAGILERLIFNKKAKKSPAFRPPSGRG